MTNTTNQLSGLELRKQVAMKLGWRAIYGEGYGWSLIDPDGDIPVLSREPTEELAWQSCPAFESDLGALQVAEFARGCLVRGISTSSKARQLRK